MKLSNLYNRSEYYPNGYININQDGNYTKHYYAEDIRVASKIGTGFLYESGDNSCDIVTDSNYLDERKEAQYDIMVEELENVTIPKDTIEQIVYSYDPFIFCDLWRENFYADDPENELYFYYGNHLSSTQLVTDIGANVTQAVLYTPWGTVISEYKADWMLDTIPRYLFNGKELDEESGMYYYSARYYAPPSFISRDPHFEDYPTTCPYAYCANNPVRYIDPTGMDLDISDNEQAKSDVLSIIAPQFRDRVSFDCGKVSVNTDGLTQEDIENDAGFNLINNMVGSSNKYLYEAVDKNDKNGNPILLAVRSVTERFEGMKNITQPDAGYQGQVILSPYAVFGVGDNEENRASTVFHELQEVFERTDNKLPYLYRTPTYHRKGYQTGWVEDNSRKRAHQTAIDKAVNLTPSARGYFGVEGGSPSHWMRDRRTM